MLAEWKGSKALVLLTKIAASSAFLALGLIHAGKTYYGMLVVAALAFSWIGDILLVWRSHSALMGGGMIPGMGGTKKSVEPVEVKGSFTIRTNARILANNTDEGPTDEGGMQVLRWEIGPKTFGPPMALFKLAN